MKLQLTPVFGGLVIGTGGITVTYINGTYTIGFSLAPRIITAAGPVVVGVNDAIVVLRKTVAEVTAIALPPAALKTCPVTIVDGAGVWAAFNATISSTGAGETIVGLPSIAGDANYQKFTLIPLPNIGYVFG